MADKTERIELRASPELVKKIEALRKKTGLDRTNVIRTAIMEMADNRGV